MTAERGWEGGRSGRRPVWLPAALLAAALALVVVVQQQRGPDSIPIEGDRPAPPVVEAPQLGPILVVVALPAADFEPATCPPSAPVAIVDGVIYPRTYPSPPPHVDRCLSDVWSAEDAGFRLAPAPPGSVQASGMYLLPAPAVRDVCVRAAKTLGHAVACPTRLPRGGYAAACVGGCVEGGGFAFHLRAFALPGRWCRRCSSELVVSSAPLDGPVDAVALTRCSASPQHDRRLSHGAYRCLRTMGPGYQPNLGHVLRRESRNGMAYAVSVEGLRFGTLEVVNALFDSLEVVTP